MVAVAVVFFVVVAVLLWLCGNGGSGIFGGSGDVDVVVLCLRLLFFFHVTKFDVCELRKLNETK